MSFNTKIPYYLRSVATIGLICCMVLPVLAKPDISLPPPETTGGIPLMQAITARATNRSFSHKALTPQVLSNMLYAAFGVSHEDKHTIPTALNKKDLKVFVIKSDGAYLYKPTENALELITSDDLRPLLAKQSFVLEAPVTLVYAGSNERWVPLHAGSAYQNVGLYAASVGLNNVVRGSFDEKGLAKELKLKRNESVVISQTVGWSK